MLGFKRRGGQFLSRSKSIVRCVMRGHAERTDYISPPPPPPSPGVSSCGGKVHYMLANQTPITSLAGGWSALIGSYFFSLLVLLLLLLLVFLVLFNARK